MNAETLLKILDKSIEKNGADKPVTLSHLKNIVKLSIKLDKQCSEATERLLSEAQIEAENEDWGDRDS